MTDQESNNRERLTDLEWEIEQLQRVREAVGAVVVGHNDVIDQLLISLLGGGHVLIEGAPGLGKTLLVRTVATVCGLDLSRIQFTPDLMPADITGTVILLQDEQGRSHSRSFQQGPIFAQMVLADEINRATPKTQSALLEAMQERTVTVAGSGHALPEPFFVLATQNPVEMEGTYRLPEAQIDRFFFKVVIGYPSTDILDDILAQTTGVEEPETSAILEPGEILRLQQLTRGVTTGQPRPAGGCGVRADHSTRQRLRAPRSPALYPLRDQPARGPGAYPRCQGKCLDEWSLQCRLLRPGSDAIPGPSSSIPTQLRRAC